MTKEAQAAAKPKKGGAAAAASEVNGKGHEVNFRGIAFMLPPKLPMSVAFDLAGASGAFADLRCLASILGPEQTQLLRAKLDEDEVSLDPDGTKALGGLVEQALACYGFDTGE